VSKFKPLIGINSAKDSSASYCHCAFTLKSKRIILPLNKSLLRPHLDYGISA